MVEIVLAIALSTIFFLAIYEIILFSNKITANNLRSVEATHFAAEAIEAVRLIRNNGWSTYIDVIPNSTTYYITMVGDQWTLTTVAPPVLNGIFTRSVTFYEVQRDANGDIGVGAVDTKTRRVVSMVSWSNKGESHNASLEAYITNILSN